MSIVDHHSFAGGSPSLLGFSQKLRAYYEQSKDDALFCLWLGTYPVIAFFHPTGLEVGSSSITPENHRSLSLSFGIIPDILRQFEAHL